MKKIHENIPHETLKIEKEYRDSIDLLRSRANMLTGKDKLLMIMHLSNSNSFRQMARLAGVSEASIARRIRKVTKRLTNGKYITCLRSRDKLTSAEMAVAKDYFLLGLSQGKIAIKRSCSVYHVRKTLKTIQHLINVADSE